MARFEREQSEYIEKVVYLNRVSKTVKGGRVMKFSALMVVLSLIHISQRPCDALGQACAGLQDPQGQEPHQQVYRQAPQR